MENINHKLDDVLNNMDEAIKKLIGEVKKPNVRLISGGSKDLLDYYKYENLTGVSGVVTGKQRLGPDLPDGWSWTENSVSGWMSSSSDIRNGAQTWALNCVPAFSGAVVTGQVYPD